MTMAFTAPTVSASALLAERSRWRLLDVREPAEWEGGHIPGAVLVPRADLEANPTAYLDVADPTPTALYCASGQRSAAAARALAAGGYRLLSLDGGIGAWRAAGGEVAGALLTAAETDRYSRHLLLEGLGARGQRALLDARVLVVGAGGLGSPAALYLAAAGVGTLGLLDNDVVELSNLQRQILHTASTVGQAKTVSAATTVRALNPEIKVVEHNLRLDAGNALEIISGYDVVVDGADNFPTRYLLSDVAVRLRVPIVSASILGWDGQLTVFAPALGGPCYRCLYPQPPPAALAPSCSQNGVLGAMAGVIGTMQAVEVVKLITGTGQPLIGRLLLYDALTPEVRLLRIARDHACPACGDSTDTGMKLEALPDYAAFCAAAG